jgi:uncharacterized protein YbbC (DUF1343 family)
MRALSILRRHVLVEAVLLAAVLLGGCAGAKPNRGPRVKDEPARPAAPRFTVAPPSAGDEILLGIDVLESQGFALVRGKRIGLLTHPAGVNRFGVSTIEVIRRDPRNTLVALFGPEHGIYGDEKAEKHVPDRVDSRTGLHVFSLYGPARKPTPAMLRGIDVLVIDLQDIGVRSYTYASCMRYAIEACFENKVAVVVLDRPNPLGGLQVGGPPLEPRWRSYVGAFPVPYIHGLTIGELARMAASEPGILAVPDEVRRAGRLDVVPMRGWRREQTWPQTGLAWKPTSPNIPDFDAVLGYSLTGLGAQLGGFRHGIGTPHPFRLLSHPALAQAGLAATLGQLHLAGLRFVPRTVAIPAAPNVRGARPRIVEGVYVDVADWTAVRPAELSFAMMRIAARLAAPRNPFASATKNEADLFNKHVGSTAFWQALVRDGARIDTAAFVDAWEREARAFQERSRRYWFYR